MTTCVACGGSVRSDEGPHRDTRWEVRVDLRPFEEPVSTYVEAGDGGIQRITYSVSRFLVLDYGRRPLAPTDASRIERMLTSSGLQRALRRGSRTGDGLTRGDLVQVWAAGHELDAWTGAGFLHEFTGPAGELIEAVLELGAAADEAGQAAAGFARSEPIDDHRRRAIERRGLVQVVARDELPPGLAVPLAASWERPGAFIALDAIAVELFEAAIEVGREIFIEHGRAAYQTTLYLRGEPSAARPAPTRSAGGRSDER